VVESIQLAQQATLETREAKHEPRTLTEQRGLGEQAQEVLGGPHGVTNMVTRPCQRGEPGTEWPRAR
jgi:hypothetical protein